MHYLSRLMTKSTKWHEHPAKTQISLDICLVWSESSLSAWRNIGSLAIHWAHSEDSNQNLRWAQRSFCWFCHEVAEFSVLTGSWYVYWWVFLSDCLPTDSPRDGAAATDRGGGRIQKVQSPDLPTSCHVRYVRDIHHVYWAQPYIRFQLSDVERFVCINALHLMFSEIVYFMWRHLCQGDITHQLTWKNYVIDYLQGMYKKLDYT